MRARWWAALTAAVVARGPWGRLLGYDRDQVRGPWLLETLARRILRRTMTRVAWTELIWEHPPSSDPIGPER